MFGTSQFTEWTPGNNESPQPLFKEQSLKQSVHLQNEEYLIKSSSWHTQQMSWCNGLIEL